MLQRVGLVAELVDLRLVICLVSRSGLHQRGHLRTVTRKLVEHGHGLRIATSLDRSTHGCRARGDDALFLEQGVVHLPAELRHLVVVPDHKVEEQGKRQLLRCKVVEPLALAHGGRVGAELIHQVAEVGVEIGRCLDRFVPNKIESGEIRLESAKVGIVRLELRLVDFEGAQVQRLDLGKPLFALVGSCQTFQRFNQVNAVGTRDLLKDRERFFLETFSLIVFAEVLRDGAEIGEASCCAQA